MHEEIEKAIKRDSKIYTSALYNLAPDAIKLQILKKTLMSIQSAEKSGVEVIFRGERLFFAIPEDKCRKVNVEFNADIAQNASGAFIYHTDNPTIYINPAMRIDGVSDCGNAVHERTHASQEVLVSLIDNYNPGSLEHEFLTLLSANINNTNFTNMFGMQFDTQTYVKNDTRTDNQTLNFLCKAFYRLSIVERYANNMEHQYIDKMSSRTSEIMSTMLSSSVSTIKNRYRCHNLTDNEIYELIDNAYLNVHKHRTPVNALDSLITYDLVAALSYQGGYLTKDQYEKTVNVNCVSYELAQWNLNNPDWKVPLGEKTMAQDISCFVDYLSYDKVLNLSKEKQINNPQIWAYAIANYGERGAALVFDKEAFLDWCMSKQNDLGNEHMDIIAKYMGPEFSAQSRQIAIDNLKRAEEDRKIKERSQLAEKYSYGITKQIDREVEHDRQSWLDLDR